MRIKRLKGTEDILPDQVSGRVNIEEISRRIFKIYGYGEIRTPIIEETGLFARSVGRDTEIVKKQMYSFRDQGGRDISLRPEETASVVRAYLEQNLDKKEGFIKLFYMGPMFRCERPQAGRLRQFYQIGVEAIGSYSPYVDAEVIMLLDELLKGYGLSDYIFKINSLGCKADKDKIEKILRGELKESLAVLCDDCRRRYETNILRILDCKKTTCSKVVKTLSLDGQLCTECTSDFGILQNTLDRAGLKYEVSPLLVRGLDYYTKTVFEVVTDMLGAQDAIAAGGRYDNLVSDLGGPDIGCCGFAIGVERVVGLLLKNSSLQESKAERKIIFIATLGEEARKEGFGLMLRLRKSGLSSDLDYQQRSLKAQMRFADKLNARYVIIIGDDELKERKAVIKDMEDGSQESILLDGAAETLRGRV